jgi:PAS domain S-box-containing protein
VTGANRVSPRHRTAGGLASLLVLLLIALARTAAAAPSEVHSVLLVFDLRSTAPSVAEMEPAFRRTLDPGDGIPVDLHVEYLDLTDTSGETYERRLVELLQEKYATRRFDVVLTDRPEALGFVLRHRDELFGATPVVFTNVNREEVRALHPANSTGAFLNTDTQRTIGVALDLHPAAKRLVIVGGASKYDRDREVSARRLLHDRSPGTEIVSLIGQPIEQQILVVSKLTADSIVLFSSYRVDSLGRSMVAQEVLQLIFDASGAPVYGAAHPWLGHGIVGGDLVRYDLLAERAAGLTNRILRGEPPSSIVPIDEPSSEVMFDWKQLKRWNIAEASLPAGSVVMFRELSAFEIYRWYIIGFLGVALIQTVLISGMLIERRIRRRAEAGVREAEQRYRTVADFNYDWEDWRRPDGSYAYVSPSCLRITGYQSRAFYERPSLIADMVVAEDRARWSEHAHAATEGLGPPGLEFRITTASGELRWIEHVCAPVIENNVYLGVRGSNRDITDRKRKEEELNRAFQEIKGLREQLEVDNSYLSEELRLKGDFEGVIGSSDALSYVLGKAKQVAATSSTVLLLGETGVGKDIVATAIHNLSPRRSRPLIRVNCAALPPSLIESELFGHEKGAFTGANTQRKGRFEIAHGTTLFLDEVGELPLELQAKLLRVLQDGQFERVGGNVTIKTDVRIIAATNRDLAAEIKAGRFREDLWYRLNVFPITIPPLRQRREDIPALLHHFVEKHCRRLGRPQLDVTKATLRDLQSREWIGNVRELESVVERAVITSRGPSLQLVSDTNAGSDVAPASATSTGPKTLARAEHDHILATVELTGWRLEGDSGAAALLGINPSTLRSRMSRLGIRRPGTLRPAAPHEEVRP